CKSSLLDRPRPHAPTLFPYTTLFRSNDRYVGRASANVHHHVANRFVNGNARADSRKNRLFDDVSIFCPSANGRFNDRTPLGRSEDRKSTRLNSSHLVISYAVFCLTKK